MTIQFQGIFNEAGTLIGVKPANDETYAYMEYMERDTVYGARHLLLALFQKPKATKVKTYSSTRTRSERWRAGSKSSRPKHNWSKKKRQRWLP